MDTFSTEIDGVLFALCMNVNTGHAVIAQINRVRRTVKGLHTKTVTTDVTRPH